MFSNGASDFYMLSNAFTDGTFKYANNGPASSYRHADGAHIWYQAPSGTAGNAISFTQAMTLGSNSGLSIGTPSAAPSQGLLVQGSVGIGASPSFKLDVNSLGYGIQHYGNGSNYLRTYAGSSYQVIESNGTNQFGYFNGNFFVQTSATDRLTISSTGAATFSSSVTATNLYLGSLTNEQLMISGTGSRGIGVSTITSGDPFVRLYDNTTIKADIWWGRSGNYMGVNSLGAGSITAINPNGGVVLIGTITSTGSARRLQVAGDVFVDDNTTTGNGVQLKNADRPLITRGWDAFTSGNKTGVGRWGVYMESAELFLGSPGTDYTNGLVTIGGWLVDGTRQPNLTVNNQTRNVTAFGSITATSFIPSGSTVPTNGMYLPSANTIAFSTNTTQRISVSSAGELQLKQSSNSAQNSVIFNTTIQNAMTLNSSGFLILNGTTGSSRITCYGDGYFSGGIQTGNPYLSTSANWLLGRFLTETTSANGSIRVQIGSKYYNIAAEDLGEVPT
jgi:hypothetical protein